jgi:hypothetical protein
VLVEWVAILQLLLLLLLLLLGLRTPMPKQVLLLLHNPVLLVLLVLEWLIHHLLLLLLLLQDLQQLYRQLLRWCPMHCSRQQLGTLLLLCWPSMHLLGHKPMRMPRWHRLSTWTCHEGHAAQGR